MIIAHVTGGLGNQMFQYAAGKALAQRHNTTLKLDTSSLSKQQLRNFSLGAFPSIDLQLASIKEIEALKKNDLLFKVINKLKPASRKTFFRETHFDFNTDFSKLSRNVYIKGYWQSEKYFSKIQSLIRENFIPGTEYIQNVESLARQMTSQNSIAVHIRRGDYTNKTLIEYHGILPLSYYQKALALMEKEIVNPIFYFFSDDMEWVQANFPLPKSAILISGISTFTQFEDLYLMSKCRHNITANSSFSWWAAWLNDYTDKKIIAPEQWFANKNLKTNDRIPPGWQQLC